MADPTNVLTIDDVAMMTGRRVRPVAASVEDLNLLLARLARMDDSIEDIIDDNAEADEEEDRLVDEADSDAPVIKLVHSIVAQAVQQGASDIHFNPEEGDTRVLFRVDGVLAPAATVKRRMAMGVVSRIKIMGDLDISERRVPQDGRFALTVDGRRVDIRVVTLPLVHGEGVVMRILDKAHVVAGLDTLGHADEDASSRFSAAIRQAQRRRAGDGPDRLGQVDDALRGAATTSTTANAASSRSRTRSSSSIAGIKQMQIAPKAGRDVRRRAALDAARRPRRDHGRRDPRPRDRADRDRGGADRPPRAVDAAHARRAERARPADRHGHRAVPGRPRRSTASSRSASCALLCKHCKKPQQGVRGGARRARAGGRANRSKRSAARAAAAAAIAVASGVYEVMTVSERIRALILERASVDVMVTMAVSEGMRRLRDDGLDKVREGLTSIAEVERMTNSLL